MSKLIIPVYQPNLTGNEKTYVNECLNSTWISSRGKFIDEFEKSFAKYINIPYATSVSNGTVALHLALIALNIGPGDEVIVPTLTYVASVNTIVSTGAKPVFVDSLSDTWQMDPAQVAAKITPNTKAIMAVHLYGHPCAMTELVKLATQYKLFLIEDCAEALGSFYQAQHVGTFGHIATFSFYGNKTITTGEGGMVVMNDIALLKRCQKLKSQGLDSTKQYWHDVIGYNYRMTNICAAIGLAQLERIQEILAEKQKIAQQYRQILQELPLTFHQSVGNIIHSYWMCSVLIDKKYNREKLRTQLAEAGIETKPVFYPVHTMPMYNYVNESYPVADDLSARGINLPSWPGLELNHLKYIAKRLKDFF